jgi:hypothetical protein
MLPADVSPKVGFWEVCPGNRWNSSRAAGNTPAKRPGSRYLAMARLARPVRQSVVLKKGDGRIKRLCR